MIGFVEFKGVAHSGYAASDEVVIFDTSYLVTWELHFLSRLFIIKNW